MIKIEDLQEAIAECQGVRNPTSATCIKLAAYYTILDHLENKQPEIYSYTMPSIEKIDYKSNSEFGQLIDGKDINDILPIIDELMDTLQILNPRLYNGVLNKIEY